MSLTSIGAWILYKSECIECGKWFVGVPNVANAMQIQVYVISVSQPIAISDWRVSAHSQAKKIEKVQTKTCKYDKFSISQESEQRGK